MKYVYLLQSVRDPAQRYVGLTADPEARLKGHNARRPHHTAKHAPWKLVVTIGFEDDSRAHAFERYLKSGSGRAFANRHLW
jgi:predicted GIY-YIG superfamily endonuclease